MIRFRPVPVVFALLVLAFGVSPAPGFAAQRARGAVGGRTAVPRTAVPRTAVPRAVAPRVTRPVIVSPGFGGRNFYGAYGFGYRPGFSLGIYAGYPYGYLYPYGYYGYGYPYAYPYSVYAYPYGYPYTAGYPYAAGYPYTATVYGSAYGSLRIEGAPRDAQVFADGYYVGNVDDFDGTFQRLDLTPGAHHIEIRTGSAPPIAFDVRIEPGHTITYHADAAPR
jgi:hypothetical protein